jgi:hypothetical protein
MSDRTSVETPGPGADFVRRHRRSARARFAHARPASRRLEPAERACLSRISFPAHTGRTNKVPYAALVAAGSGLDIKKLESHVEGLAQAGGFLAHDYYIVVG